MNETELHQSSVFIRPEARLPPNIRNTLLPILMVFTHSGITLPKVNLFGRDLQIVFLRSNRISNRIGRPIRFRIEFSNRTGRIYHASRNTV